MSSVFISDSWCANPVLFLSFWRLNWARLLSNFMKPYRKNRTVWLKILLGMFSSPKCARCFAILLSPRCLRLSIILLKYWQNLTAIFSPLYPLLYGLEVKSSSFELCKIWEAAIVLRMNKLGPSSSFYRSLGTILDLFMTLFIQLLDLGSVRYFIWSSLIYHTGRKKPIMIDDGKHSATNSNSSAICSRYIRRRMKIEWLYSSVKASRNFWRMSLHFLRKSFHSSFLSFYFVPMY